MNLLPFQNGIHLDIFADDLCIFADGVARQFEYHGRLKQSKICTKCIQALQEGVLFTQ